MEVRGRFSSTSEIRVTREDESWDGRIQETIRRINEREKWKESKEEGNWFARLGDNQGYVGKEDRRTWYSEEYHQWAVKTMKITCNSFLWFI